MVARVGSLTENVFLTCHNFLMGGDVVPVVTYVWVVNGNEKLCWSLRN